MSNLMGIQSKRNPMRVEDVTSTTNVDVSSISLANGQKVVSVVALKPCGCDGPWLGSLRQVPPDLWPERFAGKAPHGRIKLWEFYPVRQFDNYRLATRPVGMAFGKSGAAYALRDHIAIRNATRKGSRRAG